MFKNAEKVAKKLAKEKNEELRDLGELLLMQQQLDLSIYKEKGIKKYPLEEVQIALIVEIGEMMNEAPSLFKYWKDTAVDDRVKALEEYVDCLHFALSLLNYRIDIDIDPDSFFIHKKRRFCYSEHVGNDNSLPDVIADIIDPHWIGDCLYSLFDLGNYLGFTWDEIYTGYKKKNEINYKRLNSGY